MVLANTATVPTMVDPAPLTSPPRAPLAFRVGIVGHRPNRMPDNGVGQAAIRARLAGVLEAVAAAVSAFPATIDPTLYSPEPPVLRAVSSLAEGADRVFAEEALRLGYELYCPMPFPREEFERDFAPDRSQEAGSLQRFREVLAAAEAGAGLSVFELDGARSDSAGAYRAAGRMVINQSDLLVAVWDGGRPEGGGGTVETLQAAIRFHLPVIWIDARAPYGWTLLREAADLKCLAEDVACRPTPGDADEDARRARLAEAVRVVVFDEIGLPRGAHLGDEGGEAKTKVEAFFRERRPSVNLAFAWKLFRDLVGAGRFRMPSLRVGDFVAQIRRGWPVSQADVADGEPPPHAVAAWVNDGLRAHYAWSARLADLYADAHRSTYVVASLFAAVAVFLALLPMAMGWGIEHRFAETLSIVAELAVLSTMVCLLVVGRRRRWHERWLEYRVLAEFIRELRLLTPLGGGRPLPRTPAHLAIYGDPGRSWMYWHVRAIARSVGIPNVRVTPAYAAECVDYLYDIADGPIVGQHRFHESSHTRSERVHERLHRATIFLFWVSIAGIGVHLVLPFQPWLDKAGEDAVDRWLVLLSAVAPALGAALASINNQGEFSRLSKRSRAMADGFARFKSQIAELKDRLAAGQRAVPIAEVTALASEMAEMMVDENIDWRVVVLDLPHVAG